MKLKGKTCRACWSLTHANQNIDSAKQKTINKQKAIQYTIKAIQQILI